MDFLLLNTLPLLATAYILKTTQHPQTLPTNSLLLLTTLFSRWALTYSWIIPRRHKTKIRNRLSLAVPNLLLATFFTALTLPLMFGALILFHAPATPSPLPTLILSLHLAFLTLYPILSIHVHSRIPLSLMSSPSFLASELEVVVAGVGVLVGLWASGAVGLLDWGRGWQGWPVPGVVGACVGLWGGSLVGVVGRGLQSGVEKRR